ncbi:MAG: hypothetical protein JRF07_06255 [Deltaproteobacteria bacterium]|nr:hypothetical protein [Deltaproteobacteria bacterium]
MTCCFAQVAANRVSAATVMAVAALGASDTVEIKDTACTETSFPGFWNLLEQVKA